MTLPLPTQTFLYQAFILRVWCEGDGAGWRASIQKVGETKRTLFNSLEQLCVYLLTLDEITSTMITSDIATVNETSAPPLG